MMGKDARLIERVADDVLAALQGMDARGAAKARTQRDVARFAGTNPRTLQDATLALNLRGVPVCTSCGEPPGMYLAETIDELKTYAGQLRARLLGNGKRMAAVNRIVRRLELESDGRLFA